PFLPGISATMAAFSRDGRGIAYTALPENTLWRCAADGAERLQLTTLPMQAALPRWSPDGQSIAFMGRLPGRPWKVYLLPSKGGKPNELFPGERNEADPDWSPDGMRLVFGGIPKLDGVEHNAIYVANLRTREIASLPGSGDYFSPRWSPDGRHLAALRSDGKTLVLYDFESRRWSEWASLPEGAGYPAWSSKGEWLYLLHRPAAQSEIVRLRLRDGRPEVVASLKEIGQLPFIFGSWIGLTPAGEPLTVRDLSTQDIYALEWQAP
ncbi:MAG: hypothetical protein M3Y07_11680, partial [Acidobacteriota bacterium]|nr:hypothetical protein [Acidobacteriota bacterium]